MASHVVASSVIHHMTWQILSARPEFNGDICRAEQRDTSYDAASAVCQALAAGAYKEPTKSGTKLFQSDAIASVYENGWRQSFSWAGFPACAYTRPVHIST